MRFLSLPHISGFPTNVDGPTCSIQVHPSGASQSVSGLPMYLGKWRPRQNHYSPTNYSASSNHSDDSHIIPCLRCIDCQLVLVPMPTLSYVMTIDFPERPQRLHAVLNGDHSIQPAGLRSHFQSRIWISCSCCQLSRSDCQRMSLACGPYTAPASLPILSEGCGGA